MKFKTKPVIKEAIQYTPHSDFHMLAEWSIQKNGAKRIEQDGPDILIHTLEGTMRAIYYDWIIKGTRDEFYPCKPDIFEETYEPLETANQAGANEEE